LGFPTGWSFTTHKDLLLHIIITATSSFLAPSPSSSFFSGAVAGEERILLRGEFFTHTYFTLLLFCFTLFILPASLYIKNTKKLESLVVVISLL
jgi:hypothetical protein